MQIKLRFDNPETVATAAQFVAELVKNNVVGQAHEDIGTAVSGLSGAPILSINVTGY